MGCGFSSRNSAGSSTTSARLACCALPRSGEGTARAIGRYHLKIECQPKEATAEALADAMVATGSLDNAKVLVITGNLNRDTLVTKLRRPRLRSWTACRFTRRRRPMLAGDPAAADFQARGADAILFASSSAAQSFADQAAALQLAAGATKPLAGSIGPQTSATMKQAGIPVDFTAKTPGLDALVDALVKKLARG
jgi:uroporphyrinogen-III synthase